ncbi:hypothetical protein UFOVP195_11 [uncultured Caudovirales phage]|uniref:Uncharacterized protein n=1 Tax=uncultured Caudovirales phage TaxID=2100421 RepID=A0A6J7WGR9_9CAUD|nr:hypothetical protein UFOVP195_11 [uncultured Caudovirales phage]
MMHPNTEAQMLAAVDLVREARDGISTRVIQQRMGITHDKTRKILGYARKLGLIDTVGSATTASWALPLRAEELNAGRWTKRRLQYKACRENKKLVAVKPKKAPKPFRLHAPNSIWQLADFL